MCQTDAECVQQCLDGHPEVFRHLVSRYEVFVRRYLAVRLRDENEIAEAAQETMVRAYFSLRSLKNTGAFASWLVGIAERVTKEVHRTRHRRASVDVGTLSEELETSSDEMVLAPEELSRAVAELPEKYRELVLLRFYDGRSCAEISRHFGVPLGTVTSGLSRAYAMLRQSLRERENT